MPVCQSEYSIPLGNNVFERNHLNRSLHAEVYLCSFVEKYTGALCAKIYTEVCLPDGMVQKDRKCMKKRIGITFPELFT